MRVVKSKMPPQSGSSLEAVEPEPQKEVIKDFFWHTFSVSWGRGTALTNYAHMHFKTICISRF